MRRSPEFSKLLAVDQDAFQIAKLISLIEEECITSKSSRRWNSPELEPIVGNPCLENADCVTVLRRDYSLPALAPPPSDNPIYVTRDPAEAMTLADRIVMMDWRAVMQRGCFAALVDRASTVRPQEDVHLASDDMSSRMSLYRQITGEAFDLEAA